MIEIALQKKKKKKKRKEKGFSVVWDSVVCTKKASQFRFHIV
jgi:hypothetical protein